MEDVIVLIGKARTALDNIIASGYASKDEENELYDLIEKIEERKEYFLDQASRVKAMQERIDKVTRGTGISTSDLNVTRDIVKRGIKQSRRRIEPESALSRIKAIMPGAYKFGEEALRGAKVAAFGPFTPIADIVGSMIGGFYKLARSIGGRVAERREERIGVGLRPMAASLPTRDIESVAGYRFIPPALGRFGGVRSMAGISSLDSQVAPLTYFFGNKAYRVKWTKELMERIKGIDKKKEDGFGSKIMDLLSKFGGLLKPGAIVAGAVGAVVSVREIYKAGQAFKELEKARSGFVPIARDLAYSNKQWMDLVKTEGLESVSKRLGKTPHLLAIERASIEQKQALAEIRKRKWYERGPLGKILGRKKPEIKPFYERVKEIEKIGGYKTSQKIDTSELNKAVIGNTDEIRTLSKSVDKLSDSVRKDKEFPHIKEAGVGNMFDSADPLITMHASGLLTVKE